MFAARNPEILNMDQNKVLLSSFELLGERLSLKIFGTGQAKVQAPPPFTMIIITYQTKVLFRLSLAAKISLQ